MKKVLLVLVCILSLVSCSKEISVIYVYGLVIRATDPSEITDAGKRDAYESFLHDMQRDFAPEYYFYEPNKIDVIKEEVGVKMIPENLPAEDEKMIAKFNDYLTRIQAAEASCRERLEDLDELDGVPFTIKGKFLLRRGREGDKSEFLKEYRFELKKD